MVVMLGLQHGHIQEIKIIIALNHTRMLHTSFLNESQTRDWLFYLRFLVDFFSPSSQVLE